MKGKIDFQVKEKMVDLSGACFWYWRSFYSFLDSCGVARRIQDRFPRDQYNKYTAMRGIISYLEDANDVDTLSGLISGFYKLKKAQDLDSLDNDKAVKLLGEFRILVGSDPIENELKRREAERLQKIEAEKTQVLLTYNSKLEELKLLYFSMFSRSDISPQQRGFELEKLFFDLLALSEFSHSPSYRTSDGEQIDGHFIFDKFHYLVELKWVSESVKQKDVSIFDGKIRGKAQSTRGLFLSINSFDDNCIAKYSGDSPRIIFMTGEDLAYILENRFSLYDAMSAKVHALTLYGNVLKNLREIV